MDDYVDSLLGDLPNYLMPSFKRTLGVDDYAENKKSNRINKIYKLILKKRELLSDITEDGLKIYKQEDDERLVLTALNSNPKALEFVSSVFQDREDIIFSFIDDNPSIYEFASPRLKNTKELIVRAVQINGLILEYASEDLKDDEIVVYEAVNNNGMALKYASNNRKSDRKIVKKALENNGMAIRYADSKLWSGDRELILIALNTQGARLYIHDIDDELKNDLNFIIECCKIEPKFFTFASNYVKDVLTVQYIKSFANTLLSNASTDINTSHKDDSINLLTDQNNDEELLEFENKKNRFIKEIKRYYLADEPSENLLYEIFKNKINYEVDLTISSIVYLITDFDKHFDLFRKNIDASYDLLINLFCDKYNMPIFYFEKNANYDLLPDNFYDYLIDLKETFQKNRGLFRKKLLEVKEKFLDNGEYSLFSYCIDIEIEKYINNYDNSDDFTLLMKFKDYLDKIKKISSEINQLWDMFYNIDREKFSFSELQYFRNAISVENIMKNIDNLGLDNYELKLRNLHSELRLYCSNDKKESFDEIEMIYQLVLDEYKKAILELASEPGFYNDDFNYFDVISDVFLDFYDCYSKIFRKSDCSAKDICDLKAYIYEFQDRIHNYRNSEKYAFHIAMFLSLYQNHKNSINNLDYKEALDEFLECRYHFILNEYIEKLSDLRLVNKKNILKAYTKKMAIAHNIYLSYKYGNKNFEEVLKKLNEFDFDNLDSIILIDDIRVGLPLNDEFSGDYFYTVNDFSEGETEIVLTTSDGGHVCKCLSYDYEKTIPLREFIDDMEYAGVWDMGALGIRHIIYKNNEYCLAIQEDIFDNNYFLVLPVSRLNDRLMNYNNNIEEKYRCYMSKDNFMNDFEKHLRDGYLELTGRKTRSKTFHYGD